MRPSFLRLAVFSALAASVWLGCIADDPSATPLAICPRYCDEVLTKCPDLLYDDREQCLAACNQMEQGAEGDTGNTAGCRLTQATAATKGDAASCRKASAYGGGACGESCVTFCSLVDKICIQSGHKPYPAEGTCREECGRELKPKYDPARAEGPGADASDTLNCRMYHLLLALDDKPTHCAHVGLVSATCK